MRLAALGCITPSLSNYTEIKKKNKSTQPFARKNKLCQARTPRNPQHNRSSCSLTQLRLIVGFYSASSVKKFSPKYATVLQNPAENFLESQKISVVPKSCGRLKTRVKFMVVIKSFHAKFQVNLGIFIVWRGKQ